MLPTLIHVYVYLTNNNQNFKALEFLKAKFFPEKKPFFNLFTILMKLLSLVFFFSVTNLQVKHSFLKKTTFILHCPHSLPCPLQ